LKDTKQGALPVTERELLSTIKTGIAYVERGDYRQGFAALQASYGRATITLPVDGLSHYGLCVAVLEKQTRKGVEFCRMAINEQFFNSMHFVNLVRLYIIRNNRKAAVHAFPERPNRLPGPPPPPRVRRRRGHRGVKGGVLERHGVRKSPKVLQLPQQSQGRGRRVAGRAQTLDRRRCPPPGPRRDRLS